MGRHRMAAPRRSCCRRGRAVGGRDRGFAWRRGCIGPCRSRRPVRSQARFARSWRHPSESGARSARLLVFNCTGRWRIPRDCGGTAVIRQCPSRMLTGELSRAATLAACGPMPQTRAEMPEWVASVNARQRSKCNDVIPMDGHKAHRPAGPSRRIPAIGSPAGRIESVRTVFGGINLRSAQARRSH